MKLNLPTTQLESSVIAEQVAFASACSERFKVPKLSPIARSIVEIGGIIRVEGRWD